MPSMLSWVNLADTAQEITATREATGLGVRGLLTEPVSDVWRVPNVSAATETDLDITLEDDAEIGVIALFAPRDSYLPSGYTIEIFASSVAIGDQEVLHVAAATMSLSANRGAWWHWPAAPITARYIRLRFAAGASDEYLQFGRLWLGPDFRPTVGADAEGFRRGWADAGQVERAPVSGIASPVAGATYRTPSWILPMLDEDEADEIEDCAAAVGTTRQVIANASTDRGAKTLVLGRFAAPPAPALVHPTLYRCDIAMLEDL